MSTTPVDFVSIAEQVAQEAVDAFAKGHPALAGQIDMEIVGLSGHPASELVEQSREADLLVLGHRGRGAITSTFLSSVGLNCVLHAHCPVTRRAIHPRGGTGARHSGAAAPSAV